MWYALPRQAGLPGFFSGQLRWVLTPLDPQYPPHLIIMDHIVISGISSCLVSLVTCEKNNTLENLRDQVVRHMLVRVMNSMSGLWH